MAWHRIEHRKSGEVLIVASLKGYDRREWKAVRVKSNRAPGEFQTINADGSVTTDKERRNETKRKAAILAMDSADRFDRLMTEIEALKIRLDKAGL